MLEFATEEFDGSDYGRGQIETVAQTTENLRHALGRLLGVLADKGHISEQDVYFIIKDYNYSE